jgi:hypothetical protein
MIYTYLAIISILTPFLLIFFFEKKKLAFLYIFNFFVLFHLIISLSTQTLGIFNLKLLITINTLIALGIILFLFKKKPKIYFKKNWWIILFFAIIFFQLFSVHNFYDGTITTINGYQEVENFKYHKPYFSDEWITSLFSKYSIETGNLPTKNPMNYEMPIVNLLIPYFSFVSNFFLISNVDPVDSFYIFPLITGLLISVFSFILIRSFKVKLFPALITTIFITYITNGANLPGIWYLLPYTLGLIMFLNTLIFIRYEKIKFIILSAVLSIILYPPIAIFSIPSVIGYLYKKESSKKVLIYSAGAVAFLTILALIIFVIGTGNTNIFSLVKQIITEYIFREGVEDGIPSYSIFNIIPVIAVFLGAFGYYQLIKHKIYEFVVPITIGLLLWIFYTTTTKVFFIEYPRVVVITSILIVIISGITLDQLWRKYISNDEKILFNFNKINFNTELVTKIIVSVFIIFYAFSYTSNSDWDKLILVIDKDQGIKAHPAAPANQYLTEEDEALFKKFSNKRFISNDWKGLVLGVATNNIPMNTKSSIISNNYLAFFNFSSENSNCNIRRQIVSDLKVDYAYVNKVDCPGFREISKSSEGLFLYKIVD